MSQSAEKVDTQAIEKLSRRKAATASRVADLDRERGEAKQMLDDLEKNRKAAVFGALDSIKKRYFGRLLGDRGIKVKAPKVSGVVETTLGKITTIPKIVQKNMNEIEIQPILKNYAYVRILYDTMANEYFYEAIEPKLIEEESELLDVLKEILVGNLELLEGSERAQKENYLRRMVDGVLRELGVELHPVSKERIMYFVFRDFIRYGPIDVVMTDVQVEDVSCDGVRVPLYIYHRKYGSIPSNLKFDSAEELDSFVIWLAQRSGKHISVAQPMLDATIPDGSRLQATLGMHVTKRGSSFTIRRFRENPFTPLDLVRFKTMSPEMMAYLWLAIENGQSMLICGGTATGKSAYTTFHADDVQAMAHRLENDPINLPRALVAALDIVLLQAQVKVGTDMTRRVKALVEVVGTDPESNELITNSAYTWNPADDTFNYSGHSYVYEKISLARTWNQRRMEQEVKRRLDLFDYMKRNDIKNYRDVAKIVSSYYKDPDGMIKIVRDTLASQGIRTAAVRLSEVRIRSGRRRSARVPATTCPTAPRPRATANRPPPRNRGRGRKLSAPWYAIPAKK